MNTAITEIWHCATASDLQTRYLHGPYWAEVAPVEYAFGYSWTILDSQDTEPDGGWAATEAGAKTAVQDWAEADLLSDQLAAEIADGILSGAFAAYGHTTEAADRAALAVTRTTAIR